MANTSSVTPRIAELAEKLIEDIADRKLRPGDRYLTTAGASKLLGVGNGPANLALQLLARRRVISRQQRRGAFILELPEDAQGPPLHRVHFLVHPLFLRTEGVGNDHILLGIQRELPGVHVQISFLPASEEAIFVQQLIGQALASSHTDGFILVRASCETQRLVAGSGLPAVVFGSVYPGVGNLACLDRDMAGTGALLARHMLDRGHSRLAYLNRQVTYPGDHLTLDAICKELARDNRPADALTVRCLPADSEVCLVEILNLITGPNRVTALICRTRRMADAATAAIGRAGLQRDDFDIAVCDYYLRDREKPQFVYPRPLEGDEQQGQHLAKLLLRQLGSPNAEAQRVIPIAIEFPDGRGP
ncbi:Bacterial regulatory protein, gntR family [Pirellulimonas nuda]|uniref:Bacterial regulatory protein, gntR family n=1 Tax=Pirellulimonas nuda TaxID=2528009 RepID=A0A518DG83_9BACT|nr:GntR family transcriptional regulator [Pirellulimonas nuda]QDU90485.1 Bacterial regulatory protein, gntR family [Pirellulimonas nuda]